MEVKDLHAVTGAYGYSGGYIAQELLDRKRKVITLTNSLNRENRFGSQLKAYSFNFSSPMRLVENLKHVEVLYNTYWVRFNHSMFKHSTAIDNTLKLFESAQKAGVKRVVHISITNPSESSNLEYFKGKAVLEKTLINSGLSYCILRPAVIFGKEDILINNIAWILRHLPIFGVFGNGKYRLQPIYVNDLAKLAVDAGQNSENKIIDAIGPETFTYSDLVKTISKIIGKQRPIIRVNDSLGYLAGKLISLFTGDVVITREEIEGLKSDLLYTNSEPTGTTKFTDWAKENAKTLGINYASEIARRKNTHNSYNNL